MKVLDKIGTFLRGGAPVKGSHEANNRGKSYGGHMDLHKQPHDASTPAMRVKVRPEIAALPRYRAGRSLPNAIKLSSNENPTAPGDRVVNAGYEALKHGNRYPDFAKTELREALASLHGVDVNQICVGAGSSEILLNALTAVCVSGSEVVFPWRSFESYPIAVPVSGGTPLPVALTEDGRHDLPAMRAAITDHTAAIIVCSPNNPTGPALKLAEIRSFVERVPSDVLVMVDEAYIELATGEGIATSIQLVAEFPNVFVLRTFSKAYGLAGLRIGYGIGHEDFVAAVAAVAVPFGVSSVAQSAALAALADIDSLKRTRERNATERERVLAELRSLGYAVPDSESNFFWLPAQQSGDRFVAACEDADITVRPFPEGVRVTLGIPNENDRVLEVARALATAAG